MCGIAGLVKDGLDGDAQDSVRLMTQALARRGPDGEGMECWPGAILGHRRLSIFDLSDAGRQPMISPDRQVGVVFNGAIYNFRDLRAELEKQGHRFLSQCDTEVLVHGYRQWGIESLVKRLRGMFAFAIWDNQTRTLFLVRDRLGVKPLVYTEHNGGLAFASTVEALSAAGFAGDVDPCAVRDFLEFGWIPDDRSIFSGVHKVPAAAILEWRGGRVTQRSYWRPPEPTGKPVRFADAVEQAESAILEAVRIRLDADVPVGALLSAGIDSTLVCWALQQLNANIQTFTVSTPGDPGDESGGARETARSLGIRHEVVTLSSDQPPPIEELVSAYGEPFAVASALGMLQVSRAIRERVTVLLTGDGGDDVFLGYPRQRHLFWAQRAANLMPAFAARQWPRIRPLAARVPPLRRAMHFIDYATQGLGAAAADSEALGYYSRHAILGERLQALAPRQEQSSFQSARRVLTDFMEYERRMRFVSEYMTKVDGATMFHALEARAPFLDQRVWEFADALPYSVRLQGGELKAILRAIVRKRVGAQVAGRKKRGFTVPVNRWLGTSWSSELERLSSRPLLETNGWIQKGSMQPRIAQARAMREAPIQLWRLLVLEEWLSSRSGSRNVSSRCLAVR